MNKGILYGVGVGPGDPEDITLKAVRILKETDILILPEAPREKCKSYAIAVKAVPELEDKSYKALTIPMSYNKQKQKESYDRAADEILPYLEEGKMMAYITIGDPTIFSSFTELEERIRRKGYETRIISGIPSICACAAAMGIPLVKGRERMMLIPGNAKATDPLTMTEVYMKSGRHMGELKKHLQERLEQEDLQIAAVANCGYPDETICRSIEEIPENSGYMTTVIVKQR